MIAVRDRRDAVVAEGVLHAPDGVARAHVVVQAPRDYVAAEPVDHGAQIDVRAAQADVGDVGGPHLVGVGDGLAGQKVGELAGLARLRGPRAGVDGPHAHLGHQPRHHAPGAPAEALPAEHVGELPRAVAGELHVQLVDPGHRGLLVALGHPRAPGPVVAAAPGDAQELALPLHRQRRRRVDLSPSRCRQPS